MIKKGIVLNDAHLPRSINLNPVFNYIGDLLPDYVILLGDMIDAEGLHGIDHMKASDFDPAWYERDKKEVNKLISRLKLEAPKAEIVYLEGNHEARYTRLQAKFPKLFNFNLPKDCNFSKLKIKWIPYGTYESRFVLGDCVFLHGTIWPDNHAKAYALQNTPFKCIYGHLHHFQAYTTHRATLDMNPRYALTNGCLSELSPEWKRGAAHQWTNGFIDFTFDGKCVIPNAIQIENGMFRVGNKIYK